MPQDTVSKIVCEFIYILPSKVTPIQNSVVYVIFLTLGVKKAFKYLKILTHLVLYVDTFGAI